MNQTDIGSWRRRGSTITLDDPFAADLHQTDTDWSAEQTEHEGPVGCPALSGAELDAVRAGRLRLGAPGTAAYPAPVLSRGEAVQRVQASLVALGYPLPRFGADGKFGRETGTAVSKFKRANRIQPSDPVVGPQTMQALDTRCGRTPPVPPTPPPTPPRPPAPVPASLDARILRVMELLVDRYGYPVNGAAGIVGNLIAESGVQPDRIEGSRSATPMRAPDFAGRVRDFTPEEVRDRNFARKQGPRLPGIGIAQWTSPARRAGLFTHTIGGRQLGTAILADLDAQVDYLVTELRRSYRGLNATLLSPGVRVNDAADDVVYDFERPGAILQNRERLPRSDPRVQAVFAQRRAQAQRALRVYRAAHPSTGRPSTPFTVR